MKKKFLLCLKSRRKRSLCECVVESVSELRMNKAKFEELLDVDQYNNNIGLLTIKLHLLEGIQPNNSFMLRFDYSLSFSNVFIFKVSTF